METGLNAGACVGKQPNVVATASTEHPIGGCSQTATDTAIVAIVTIEDE